MMKPPMKKGGGGTFDKILDVLGAASGVVNGPQAPEGKVIGTMHQGGLIPQDGLYRMKAGEKVIPVTERKENDVEVPPSSEQAGEKAESVSSTPNKGNVIEAFPTVDAGMDCGQGHWEGDGQDVKFVKQ